MGSSSAGRNVKIVKAKSEIQRKSLNAMEQTRVNITKSGALARETAKPIERKNAADGNLPKVLRIRNTAGLKSLNDWPNF